MAKTDAEVPIFWSSDAKHQFTGRTEPKLKLHHFGHLFPRADSLEKTLMLGKTESWRRGWQRIIWLDIKVSRYEFEQTLGDGKGQASLVCSQ